MPCGGRKTFARTSFIVQIIFHLYPEAESEISTGLDFCSRSSFGPVLILILPY